jgi:hypothetical protein
MGSFEIWRSQEVTSTRAWNAPVGGGTGRVTGHNHGRMTMPQYTFRGKEEYIGIVVGWDNPLETFFVQVWDERSRSQLELDDEEEVYDEGVLCLWAGTWQGEIPDLDSLVQLVEPHGQIPDEILERLRMDFESRRPPAPLQRYVGKLL